MLYSYLTYGMSTVEGRKLIKKYRKEGYIYVGGEYNESSPEHWNYWLICCKSRFPTIVDPATYIIKHRVRCQCDQLILNNCWIYNPKDNRIKVIGSECINKFCESRRTCLECGCEHRNRKDNYCKECRKNICKCGKVINGSLYKDCYNCNRNK